MAVQHNLNNTVSLYPAKKKKKEKKGEEKESRYTQRNREFFESKNTAGIA